MSRKPTLDRSTYAVWEITLRCNLKCIHCGSRAGDARDNELSTEEALDLVHQMADEGVKEISLIGGEAFLRKDWLEIAKEIRKRDILLTMVTGAYGLGPKMASQIAEVGFDRLSISLDGLEETHDHLRGRKGSYAQCLSAFKALQEAGVPFAANTQINRLSAPELPRIYEVLRDSGAIGWQVQMTVPMGNAVDNHHLLLQPQELLDVYPVIGYLLRRGMRDGLLLGPGNNVGYFGPYERLFRTRLTEGEPAFWIGSLGGVTTLGIESDGTIKADPSLPTDDYAGGNIREKSLKEILYEADQLTLNDDHGSGHLWGFCKGCEFGGICRGGDLWTAHVFFDRPGNNPYCHHRSLVHAARDQQERLILAQAAEGVPFDNGVFDIEVVPASSPWPEEFGKKFEFGDIDWPEAWLEEDPELLDKIKDTRDRSVDVWRETRIPKASPPLVQLGDSARLRTPTT